MTSVRPLEKVRSTRLLGLYYPNVDDRKPDQVPGEED
jgi:hypothetical protein